MHIGRNDLCMSVPFPEGRPALFGTVLLSASIKLGMFYGLSLLFKL